ncbi:RNA polymerase sigma factor [uncultured Fibrella sp.]|uniref:RNA polymerase sigma factor n=1 Tax=uncultured Fibrella sp. TaxID=1284596 RepID=UPI0035CC0EE8
MIQELPADISADWLLLKQGDAAAFTRLYNQHARVLVNYGYRLVPNKELVRDVVQDLFVQLWSGRTTLPPVKSVKGYMMVAVRRQLLRQTTARTQFAELPVDADYPSLSEPSCEAQLIEHQTQGSVRERVASAVDKLPPRQREVIFLKYYSELPTQEIADIMGITPESVYKLIYKAVDNLKGQSMGWETSYLLVTVGLLCIPNFLFFIR